MRHRLPRRSGCNDQKRIQPTTRQMAVSRPIAAARGTGGCVCPRMSASQSRLQPGRQHGSMRTTTVSRTIAKRPMTIMPRRPAAQPNAGTRTNCPCVEYPLQQSNNCTGDCVSHDSAAVIGHDGSEVESSMVFYGAGTGAASQIAKGPHIPTQWSEPNRLAMNTVPITLT